MRKYIFKKNDKSTRPIVELSNNYIVTSENGLYNENLTVDELMLLRSMIWDARNENSQREIITFVHKWLFTNKKIPTVFTDIQDAIENGVNYEENNDNL